MEMDWGTALTGIVLIIICIIPLVWMRQSRVKKEKKILKSLNDIASQNNCIITMHEINGNQAIGIDKNRNHVFYFKPGKDSPIAKFVDLAKVVNCQTVKTIRNVKNEGEALAIIERIDLHFTTSDRSLDEVSFEFYVEETDLQLSGELQFAEKWTQIINEHIKKTKR